MGIDAQGKLVVLEIKCTQFPIDVHEERYKLRCVGNTTLDKVPFENTEFVIHQLQTAFGILGLRRLFPGVPIAGRVVVCADNGTKTYPCYDRYVDEAHFAHAHRPSIAPKAAPKSKLKLGALPEVRTPTGVPARIARTHVVVCVPAQDLSDRGTINSLLRLNGYKSTPNDCVGKYASFVAVKPSGIHTVCGILHDPDGPKGKRYTAARKQVVSAAKRLKKKKADVKVNCAIITHSRTKPYTFHPVTAVIE